MTFSRKFIVATGLALMLGSTAVAQSPTCTLFASNNSGSVGGAVYFDITTTTDMCISAFDSNFGAALGSPAGLDVYLTAKGTTSGGNEAIPAAWTLVASGAGVAAGLDSPTNVVLASPISLNTGTYGVALVSTLGAGHAYTNGALTFASTSGDMTINTGTATNLPFTTPLFSPRSWNGCIYFNKYGAGCAGSGGCTPDLAMQDCPVAGSSVAIHVTQGFGGSLCFFLLGAGKGPVPMGGGCVLNLSTLFPVSFAVPMSGVGSCAGEVHFKAAIPAAASGAKVNMQVFVQDKGAASGLGFSNSNGLEINIQ